MERAFDRRAPEDLADTLGHWRLGPLAYVPVRHTWPLVLAAAVAIMLAQLGIPQWPAGLAIALLALPRDRTWPWLFPGALAALMAMAHFPYVGWVAAVAAVAFVATAAYHAAATHRTVLYMDTEGVWVQRGILPWRRGVFGTKWADIERVEYQPGLLHWMSASYPVSVIERFTEHGDIQVPGVWHGRDAVSAISDELLARSGTEKDRQS